MQVIKRRTFVTSIMSLNMTKRWHHVNATSLPQSIISVFFQTIPFEELLNSVIIQQS